MTTLARSMNQHFYNFLYMTELRPTMKSRRGWRRLILKMQTLLARR